MRRLGLLALLPFVSLLGGCPGAAATAPKEEQALMQRVDDQAQVQLVDDCMTDGVVDEDCLEAARIDPKSEWHAR